MTEHTSSQPPVARKPALSWESVIESEESAAGRTGDDDVDVHGEQAAVGADKEPVDKEPADKELANDSAVSVHLAPLSLDLEPSSDADGPTTPTFEPLHLAPLDLGVADDLTIAPVSAHYHAFDPTDPLDASDLLGSLDLADSTRPGVTPAPPADVEEPRPKLPSGPAATPYRTDDIEGAPGPAVHVGVPVRHRVHRQQRGRRQHNSGGKALVAVIVLGGLVAAAVVFGRPWLFPDEWDAATSPYADAVESVRGVDFANSLSIISEPSPEFGARLQSELAPISDAELAQLRALGLAAGNVDAPALAVELAGWQDAVYSAVDGQVYYDGSVEGDQLDAQLVQAMAAASLDQQFGWSLGQARRTLDAAAATTGEVLRQSRQIQQASTFSTDIVERDASVIDALPPVIGYRLLAPEVFAEFAAEPDTDSNSLGDLGERGPGPLGGAVSVASTEPEVSDGDVLIGPSVAHDRSFWFLVLAGFLDAPDAFAASESVVESSVTSATRGATTCVYATFSGGSPAQRNTLGGALERWSATAPGEYAASFTSRSDGSMQLTSCDPGTEFAAVTRVGVARELVAWRAVELATYQAVVAAGGGLADVTNAWQMVGSSSVPVEVAATARAASPADLARSAADAVAAIYGP